MHPIKSTKILSQSYGESRKAFYLGSCTPKICRINARGMGTTTFRELFGHGKKLSSRTFSE